MKKRILSLLLSALLLTGCAAPRTQTPAATTTLPPETTAPEATDTSLIATIDFNSNWPTDSAGQGVKLTVNGGETVGDGGYDGSGAFYIGQETGYLTLDFSGVEDFSIRTDDFTISLWFKGVCGGLDRWYTSASKTTEGKKIDMTSGAVGTILFSNRDESHPEDDSGFTAAMMNMYQYFAVNVTGGDKTLKLDGTRSQSATDARWHQLALTVARDGSVRVFIDSMVVYSKKLTLLKDLCIGTDILAIGADINGSYGLRNSYIDNITVYNRALDSKEIRGTYYGDKLAGILHEVETGVAALGAEYTEQMRQTILSYAEDVASQLELLMPEDYVKTRTLCNELKDAYADFLMMPQQDAKLVSALLSDIHIAKAGDATSGRLKTAFRDISKSGLRIDTMLLTGDLADNSSAAAENAYFDALDANMDEFNAGWTAISCIGNHDVQYTNEGANYQTGVGTYWQRLQAYISLDEAVRRYGSGSLDSTTYYVDENGLLQSCSYAMTVNGYHFVVINTDYLTQTGNSKLYVDENGKYTIEGNAVDPIRHGMYMAESTLSWLNDTLAKYSEDGLPLFVVGHFPFDDTCDFSGYDEIVINDNSVGKQDAEIRNILASYQNVIYFCGHAHNSNAQGGPRVVTAENGGSFVQVNLAALKNSIRGHANIPTNWIMYVYEDEIVLRCRDYSEQAWLTEYDHIIPLK